MSALDTLFNIVNNDNLLSYDFKYCLVDSDKHPFKINGEFVKPNCDSDFCSIFDLTNLSSNVLQSYKGIGISIHASDVCAIDIDHCVSNAFDVNSINALASNIINEFKSFAYIEFSFSGHGLRILFKSNEIKNYTNVYYTKNSKYGIEYYFPTGSARYVTLTGMTIYNNKVRMLSYSEQDKLMTFLNTYMKREEILNSTTVTSTTDERSIEQLEKIVRMKYLTNNAFQDLWFTNAPGSGHDESERDFHLIAYLYENITQDKNKIKQLFEESPFFKSKDWKHLNKWNKQDFRYFNYVFERVQQKHRS